MEEVYTETRLPETKEEWQTIKAAFSRQYPIDDTPESWMFILSQLQGTKMPELTFEMENVFDHYKRWKIAKILQDEKTVYMRQLEDKLKEAIQRELDRERAASSEASADNMSIGTQPVEGALPGLPENEAGVVQTPSVPGV